MADRVLKNLDRDVLDALRVKAAVTGHSMEDLAKACLTTSLSTRHTPRRDVSDLNAAIHALRASTPRIEGDSTALIRSHRDR